MHPAFPSKYALLNSIEQAQVFSSQNPQEENSAFMNLADAIKSRRRIFTESNLRNVSLLSFRDQIQGNRL